ncbi:universal stress protein [Streptomyces sp. NPDC088353]|uniref:universal stress protein n=1 Tax=Streptomyces sp. NPDC088353 TaxID=3365855 RepID=UPI0038107A0F
MNRVIIACANGTGRGRAAVDWATREASLRGLPLEVVYGSPPDGLSPAAVLVLGLSTAQDDTAGPAQLALVAASACPVVPVPDDHTPFAVPVRHPPHVTIGLNARHPVERAIDFAFDAARLRDVRLHAVHAWELPACAAELPSTVPVEDRATWEDHEVHLLADTLRPWRLKYPRVPVLEDILLLSPTEALAHHAEGAALVVVGRGAGMGPDAVQALLRESRCPVAVVP